MTAPIVVTGPAEVRPMEPPTWSMVVMDAGLSAKLVWSDRGEYLYISTLFVREGSGDLLQRLYREFCRRYPGRRVMYDAHDDNAEMARFTKLVGAVKVTSTYETTIPKGKRHGPE